jgi:hypothetical protein
VKSTEQLVRPMSVSRIGLCAPLGAFARSKGSGAPARLLLSLLAVTLVVLAFIAAPAFAAGPPGVGSGGEFTSPPAKAAEEVRLEAAIIPNGEATECHFEYGETVVSEHLVACSEPGLVAEGGEQRGAVTVAGLKPGTTYHWRVVLKNASGKAEGKEETVTTVQVPATEAPSAVGATTATFNGSLTPLNETVPAEYVFYYNIGEEFVCTGERRTEPNGSAGTSPTPVAKAVSTAVTGLEPSQKYTVCLVSTNTLGDSEEDLTPKYFETKPAPPEIVSESASHHNNSNQLLNHGETRLEGVVNPNNQLTECHFQYGEKKLSEYNAQELAGKTVSCEPEVLKGFGEDGVAVVVGGLQPGSTYHYRLIAKNGKGEQAPLVEQTVIPEETPALPVASEPATSGVTGTSAVLHGVLNPLNSHEAEPGQYEFVYRQSASECQHTNLSTGVLENEYATSREPATGHVGEKVEAEASGLLPGATYTFCLLARENAEETAVGPPVTFTTEAKAPTVESEPFSNVGSASATLHAKIDPGGTETTYFFQYATEAEYQATKAYGAKTPVASTGAGSEAVKVQADLPELQPETLYHYRVVASNEKAPGGVSGDEGSFTTYPIGLLGLPDGRAYELVSPLNNGDASPLPSPGLPARAAADGSSVAYIGSAPPVGGKGTTEVNLDHLQASNAYLAQRSANGWTAVDIQPNGLKSPKFESFSSDLSTGILGSEQALVENAPSGEDLYARGDHDGSYELLGAGASYEGTTPDGSHILVRNTEGLYDSTGGQLERVNVLPGGGVAAGAVFGAPPLPPWYQADLGNVVSSDGSRIFWTAMNSERPEALYVREDDSSPDAVTVQLDAAEPGCGTCIGGGGVFQGANSEGSKVFFTDENQLTSNSTAQAGKPDLYEYEVNSEPGKPGTLTDLTPNTKTESANVAGVLGVSENGYVYFATAGALLGSGAERQECLPPTEYVALGIITKCNVYVVHIGEAPRLVATVSAVDGYGDTAEYSGGAAYDWVPNVGSRSAYVSADGRELVFESDENLTGFDTESGYEIYIYEYESGRTFCVSCNPTGVSTFNASNSPSHHFVEYPHAELPESENATYALRDVSADGDRVFFASAEQLVSRSTSVEETDGELTALYYLPHGVRNVYEWERDGSGGCTREKGCVYLLSDGLSSDDSSFVDASETGDDVFFETRAQLVPQDKGEAFEVYDAHVCSEAAPCPQETSTECTGTGCQGVPAAPPIFATPASVTFDGVGDFPLPSDSATKSSPKPTTCKKGFTKSKDSCVKNKKKKPRAKRAKRASRDRRAQS